ncbi:hypothetical protein [Fibrobacter sp. UWB7]|uniref:hypothetical protein n=1 Tax=Fibrobacter sp. UWB7 TaxID=1896206 RepID=UPI001FCD6382|nr:hypothetical protein [Fibrobacter sp. UWB7]
MESTVTSIGSTVLTADDVGKATLDKYNAELLLNLYKILPLSELFADVNESSPQAIKNRANKKESHKVFFIIVNIVFVKRIFQHFC